MNRQAAPQGDPAIYQEIAALRQEREAEKAEKLRQAEEAILSEIEQFKADPKNKYFEEVATDMAVLLQGGRAATLGEAYERACRMNDDVFARMQAEKTTAQAASGPSVAAKKAAGGSISTTGGPGVPTGGGLSDMDLRDMLAAQFETT